MKSIIPIAYLFIVSTIVTPITSILFIQAFNFSYRKQSLCKAQKRDSRDQEYEAGNKHMGQKEWINALIALEIGLYKKKCISSNMAGKCSNAIGFILQKTSHIKLAKKYYQYSHEICPEYSYSKKNLENLSKGQERSN